MGARRRARGDHHPTPAPRPTSGQPPPHTTRESRTAAASTHRASCRDRSASSSKWLDAPRSTMVAAAPRAQKDKALLAAAAAEVTSPRPAASVPVLVLVGLAAHLGGLERHQHLRAAGGEAAG